MISTLSQIALGGALGASARYLVGLAVLRMAGPGVPLGTLVVNIAGSFLMGAFAGVSVERSAIHFAPFVVTGLLGGFTTFSAFSLDTVSLFERGAIAPAMLYVAVSVAASIGALALGLAASRGIFA